MRKLSSTVIVGKTLRTCGTYPTPRSTSSWARSEPIDSPRRWTLPRRSGPARCSAGYPPPDAHSCNPPAASEVRVDDRLVARDDVGRSFGDHRAFGHAHDPVADVHDDVHVVLDEHDGDALVAQPSHVIEEGLHERGVHAGHRLV